MKPLMDLLYNPISAAPRTLDSEEFSANHIDGMETRQSHDEHVTQPGKATPFSCYVNLANTILGSGILALPYAFAHSGWILGTLLTIVCGASAALGLHFLSQCALKESSASSSFYTIGKKALPNFTILVDIAIALKCFGVATSYLIVIGDLMPELMKQFDASHLWQRRQLWVLIGFGVVCPLSYLPTLDALKFTSSLGLAFVTFLVLIVILYSTDLNGLNPCRDGGNVDNDPDCSGRTTDVMVNLGTLKVLPIFIYGYTCHQNIFTVVNEIESPSQQRLDMVVAAAIGTGVVASLLLAYSGYGTFGSKAYSDILMNYPDNNITSIGRLFVSLLVAFSYPLQCHPSRRCILSLWRQLHLDNACSILVAKMFALDISTYTSLTGTSTHDDRETLFSDNSVSDSSTGGHHYVDSPDSSSPCQAGEGVNKEEVYLNEYENIINDTTTRRKRQAAERTLEMAVVVTSGVERAAAEASDTFEGLNPQPPAEDDIVHTSVDRQSQKSRVSVLYILVTTCFLGCSLLIAMTVTNLGVILAIVGATGSTAVSFILPGFFYYFYFDENEVTAVAVPSWKRQLGLIQGLLGVIIIPVCLTFIFL